LRRSAAGRAGQPQGQGNGCWFGGGVGEVTELAGEEPPEAEEPSGKPVCAA